MSNNRASIAWGHQPRQANYYTASAGEIDTWLSVEGDVHVDVAIVGGGFTGIATAVELAERGLQVAVVEANRIGWGASGRNGGQVTGSLSGETALRRQLGRRLGKTEAEDLIWMLRWRGHAIIRDRVARYGIDCDLKYGHLHAAMKPSHLAELREAYAEADRRGLGSEVTLLDAAGVRDHLETDRYIGALKNMRNMHLHPLKLCLGEARAAQRLGVRLFENSRVTEIVHGPQPELRTEHGRVIAEQILLAGDVYHRLEPKRLGGMIFPAIGGIVATEPLGEAAAAINPQDLAVYDCRFVLDYFRLTAEGRLLFGGGANYSGRESRSIAAELRPAIEATFPRLRGVGIDFEWSCAMGIVINRLPQLGKLSDRVWYAQGYSGHGLATSHIVGEIMAEAISGTMSRYDTFARLNHVRVPFAETLGNPLLAAGMWYYRLMEMFR